MKRAKLAILILVLMGMILASTWAAGGLRLGLEFGDPNAVFILRIDSIDLKIGYSLQGIMSEGNNFFHISGDYRIVQTALIDFLNFYLGVGAYIQINTDPGAFSFGGRIPLGLNAYMVKNVVEIFFELVPTIRFWEGLDWGGFQGYLGFTIAIRR